MSPNLFIKKTKFMMIIRNLNGFEDLQLTCNAMHIDRVTKFKYLSCDIKIRSCIQQVREAFLKLRRVLSSSGSDLSLRFEIFEVLYLCGQYLMNGRLDS